MKIGRNTWLGLLALFAAVTGTSAPAAAQQQAKPNILFIMGDDIGIMQPRIYHRGLMVGETPNIDRIRTEGPTLTTSYPHHSSTSSPTASLTSIHPPPTPIT